MLRQFIHLSKISLVSEIFKTCHVVSMVKYFKYYVLKGGFVNISTTDSLVSIFHVPLI